MYRLEDSVSGNVEFLTEEEVIEEASVWAERIEDESEEVNNSHQFIDNIDNAIDVLESASIWTTSISEL